MRKFPSIKRLGAEENSGILERGTVTIQEKMDGGNFRFTYQDGDLIFGSRNVVWDEEKMDENFVHAVEFVEDEINESGLSLLQDTHDEFVIFGEAMHPHTISYDWESVPSFLGFDIWADGDWLSRDVMEPIYDKLDLPTVPEIYHGPADGYDVEEEYEFPDSVYRNGLPEGIVVKNEDTGQRGKYRTPEFKEVHQGQNPNKSDVSEPSDSQQLAWKYATEARISKWIHKLHDRGHDIEMSMMEDLWREVAEDIIEEEGDQILLGNYNINTKEFRSEIASECVRVLEAHLARPDDSVLNQPPEET